MQKPLEFHRHELGVASLILAVLAVGPLGWMFPVEARASLEAPPGARGVVVEEVGEGSALKQAGLLPGDILLSWRRPPNPPANSEGAQGELGSPFDWQWLVLEQAPRGRVKLLGQRQGEAMVLEVAPGKWQGDVRPWMAAAMLEDYLRGRQLIEAGELEAAISLWHKVAQATKNQVMERRLRCWLLLRIGDVWSRARQWEKAHGAYRSAFETAQDSMSQAAIWQAIGDAGKQASEFERARDAYGSAREIREKTWGDSLASARSLNDLGYLDWRQDRLDSAQGHFRRALEIRQKWAPGSLDVAASLNNLGLVAWKRGDLDRAAEYHEGSLEIRRQLAPGSLDVAASLSNLGLVSMDRGDLDRAAESYAKALKIDQKLAPGSLGVATSLNNLGLVAWKRGDLDRAAEHYQGALEIQHKLAPRSLDVALSLNNQGLVARARGDLDRAIEYLQGALDIQRELAPGSLDVARSLNNLGILSKDRGHLDRAAEYYERSLEIRQKLAPRSLDVAMSLNNLGIVARNRGDLDRATQYYEAALDIQRELAPGSLDVAMSLNNLGNVARRRGDLDQAAECYQGSLEIWRKLAPGSLVVAGSLNNLGVLASDRSDLDRAAGYHEGSLEIRQKLAPGSLVVAGSLAHLGNVAHQRGDLDQAAEYYKGSLEIHQKLAPGSSETAAALHSLASLRQQQNQPRQALALFLQALQALEDQVDRLGGSRDVQAGFRAERAGYFRDTIELSLELQQLEEAFHILERSRARSFLAQFAERELIFSDIPEELDRTRRRAAVRYDRIQRELAELSLARDKEEIEALRGKLRQLRRERDDVEEQIRRNHPDLAALQFPHPLDLRAARQVLDPGTVMLAYSLGEESTDLFVVTKEGPLEVHSLPIGEDKLTVFVRGFHNATHEPGWTSRTASRVQHARLLYDTLIEPAATALEPSDRVLIVPDGPLHLLPFAALIREGAPPPFSPGKSDGEDSDRAWHYLVEWKPVHSVLSATVFGELRKSRRPAAVSGSEAPVQLAAFGDPLYPQDLAETRPGDDGAPREGPTAGDYVVRAALERGLDFPPLPYSRREIEGIARHYPPGAVRTHLGAEATEERAKSLGRGARILHFATHGDVNDRSPLDSFVALTIPQEHSEVRDNGLLQAWEIFERVRLDADLVVLSACRSARGKELGGEGLIGLTRAFQYAGARTVAATLWNVADQATAELMIRFHRHLRAGQPKDVALQAAQIELIRGPIKVRSESGQTVAKDASAPYYWAAFQLIGDWQ